MCRVQYVSVFLGPFPPDDRRPGEIFSPQQQQQRWCFVSMWSIVEERWLPFHQLCCYSTVEVQIPSASFLQVTPFALAVPSTILRQDKVSNSNAPVPSRNSRAGRLGSRTQVRPMPGLIVDRRHPPPPTILVSNHRQPSAHDGWTSEELQKEKHLNIPFGWWSKLYSNSARALGFSWSVFVVIVSRVLAPFATYTNNNYYVA